MMSSCAGKVAVITGGSSGIGLATATLLVEHGARVLITGRNPGTLDVAATALGENALTAQIDVTSHTDLGTLADLAHNSLGTVDALFVNAGINGFAPFTATHEQLYDDVFSTNVKGAYYTVQRMLPVMADGSSIVFTTSVANVRGFPMLSAYAASKAAVRSLTRSLAAELLDRRIRVNAVSPGAIDTGVLKKSMSAPDAQGMLTGLAANNPMRRVGEPREVALAAMFLAFDATYTNGAELPVDGGGSQF